MGAVTEHELQKVGTGWLAMMKEMERGRDQIDQEMLAADALERARLLPPGPERNEALKRASLLRCSVDQRGPVFAKRGRPRK